MKETIGQIIRNLRKERGLTQEELAEQLGVTFQAISKWENDSGLPDISQVVPLATVFGVSADVLFGIENRNDKEAVYRIIEQAEAILTTPITQESLKQKYNLLQKGLAKYPSNTTLLSCSLECGIALAYPENDVFDAENGETIYKECVRQASLVIKYSENTTAVLRAHMIMVLLHSAYGNFEKAKKHAESFPWRADMTVYEMQARIAHFEKNYHKENVLYQNNFLFHLEALLDDYLSIAESYHRLGEYEKVEYVLLQALDIITLICQDEENVPRFHQRERGDIYSLLAVLYMEQNRTKDALCALEKMVEYDTKVLPRFVSGEHLKTPLLCRAEWNFFEPIIGGREKLLVKLHHPIFDKLKEYKEFSQLLTDLNIS